MVAKAFVLMETDIGKSRTVVESVEHSLRVYVQYQKCLVYQQDHLLFQILI